MECNDKEITRFLDACVNGDASASKKLFGEIYCELRIIAKSARRRWSGDYTINTTALVHEAYLKVNPENKQYNGRGHFYATAASAMRHVLVNYAEKKRAGKRKNDEDFFLDENDDPNTLEEIIFLDQLIGKLKGNNKRHCQIVECRVFAGMTFDETAKALNISVSTVKREWNMVSAWLYREFVTSNKTNASFSGENQPLNGTF